MNVIVARHNGLIQWLKDHGIVGEVITHVSSNLQIEGRHVFGMLPFNLAALAATVTVVDLPNLTPEQRGKELSVEEMDLAGAKLSTYTVSNTKYGCGDPSCCRADAYQWALENNL